MSDLDAWHRKATKLVNVGTDKDPQLYPLMRSALAHRVMHSMGPEEKKQALEHVDSEIALLKAIHDAIASDVREDALGLMGELERKATPAYLAQVRQRVLDSFDAPPPAA